MKRLFAPIGQAFSFAKSSFRWFKKKRPTVPLPVYARRLSECSNCDLRAGETCTICGCHLKTKTHWATERCPVGYWEPDSGGQDG